MGLLGLPIPSSLNPLMANIFQPFPVDEFKFDFTLWFIRPTDLLDLEFGFSNLSLKNTQLSRTNPNLSSFMIVRLPHLHVAEETHNTEEVIGDNTLSKAFLSSPSYLVFKFKPENLGTFNIAKDLLSWNSDKFYSLTSIDEKEYPFISVNYETLGQAKGIVFNKSSEPLTTLEVPAGLPLVLYRGTGGYKLSRNNIPESPKSSWHFGMKQTEAWLAERFKLFVKKEFDDRKFIESYNPYTEIWYNDIISTKKDGRLLFKVGGFNKDFTNNPYLIPNKEDKRLLYKQFIPGTKKDGEYLSPFARQPAILRKQIITSEGNSFRFTAAGLSGNLQYISPDEAAILQKYLHQIRFGRDLYVEVHRLMHGFPKPLRLVEVMVGERRIKNGVSYMERQKYLLILDKYLTFRSMEDQDTNAITNSVLQRVAEHPQKDLVNYVRSCKRSIPFQELEILTEGFIPIRDFEDDINKAIATTTSNLRQNYAEALRSPVDAMVDFLQECKRNREIIRANPQLSEAVGDDILDLCGQSENIDFIEQEFAGIVALLPGLKSKLRKAVAFMDIPLLGLSTKTKHLNDTLDKLGDAVVKSMHDAIKDSIPDAIQNINAAMDAEKKLQHDIVDYRTDTYRKVRAYWPKQKNDPTKPVLFSFRYTDWNGNTGVFSCPLILVSGESVLEIGELAVKKIKMTGTIPAELDKEIMYEQQYCLDAIQFLANNCERLKKFENLPTYISNEFERRYSEIIEQVYNSMDRILEAGTEQEKKLYGTILEFRRVSMDEFIRVTTNVKNDIESLDVKIKDKASHFLYASSLLCLFNSFKTKAATTVDQYKHIISSLKTGCNKWIGTANATVAAAWFEVNRKLNSLDRNIFRNYHSKESEYRRQIQLAQQKISYYKDKIGEQLDSKIHDLTTELMEMSATPIARMAELREQINALVPDATTEYIRLADFARNFGISYPHMVAAKVLPPLYDQLANAPSVFLSYAAPYKMAGIEAWNTTIDELEKQKRNAEQILFEIREPINTAKRKLDAAKQSLGELRAEVLEQGNAIMIDGAAAWQSFKNQAQDFETGTIGYARSSLEDALKNAHDKLGGIIDPGLVTDQISAVKGMAYSINNRVNIYKGVIERYSIMSDTYVRNGTATLNEFKDKVKDYSLDKSKVLDQIKNIKLFNLPLDKLLKGLDTYSPKDLPEASVEIIKDKLIPVAISANYSWSPNRPDLFDDGTEIVRLVNPGKKAKLSVSMSNTTTLRHPRTNTLNSSIVVSGFGISAMDIVKIHFESISYTKAIITNWDTAKKDWSASSNYSHVNVKIDKVEFSGFLELVKQLQERLGLGDGFLMDINTSGIQLSYVIRIPTIAMGGFTLSNMNLYAGMLLSFQGNSPQFRFSFGERQNPFTLAVGIYAGRGFFGMNVSSNGVELLEAALEFGAYLNLDLLGIAKGQAYLMAGIYFRRTEAGGVYVESYITCGGSLSIIGLIQVSVVFYLSLGYQEKDKSLKGRASVEVSVKVLFFSASFNLTFEKQIAGGGISFNNHQPNDYPLYAINKNAHGPNDNEIHWTDNLIDESEKYYRYLKIPSETDANKKDYLPITDPAVLYSHSMDFEKYIKQFAK